MVIDETERITKIRKKFYKTIKDFVSRHQKIALRLCLMPRD
jgi:hypothetical protein